MTSKTEQPTLRLSLWTWALGASFYFYGFFHRVTPGVLTDELTNSFHLSRAGLGNLSAFYFYFYAAMQIPVGLLVDRVGPRRILTSGCILAALGSVMFGSAHSVVWAEVGRGLIGGSVAVAWVSLLMLIARWFAPSRFATMSGLSLAVGTLGAVLAGVPLKILSNEWGWRNVMIGSGIFALLLGLLIWKQVRDMPKRSAGVSTLDKNNLLEERAIPLTEALRRCLKIPAVWLLFWAPSGICGAFLTFTGLWGVPYLRTQYQLTVSEASLIISGMLVSFALGSLAFGACSDYLKKRKLPYMVGGLFALSAYLVLGFFPLPSLETTSVLLWLSAFGGGSMVLGFGYVKESVPLALGATSVGIANFGVMVGPLVQQPLLGAILDRYALREHLSSGYSMAGLNHCMALLAIWILSCVLALAMSRETHSHPRYD